MQCPKEQAMSVLKIKRSDIYADGPIRVVSVVENIYSFFNERYVCKNNSNITHLIFQVGQYYQFVLIARLVLILLRAVANHKTEVRR